MEGFSHCTPLRRDEECDWIPPMVACRLRPKKYQFSHFAVMVRESVSVPLWKSVPGNNRDLLVIFREP